MAQPASLRILVYGDADRGDNGAPLIAIGRLLPSLPRTILDRIEVRRHDLFTPGDLVDLPLVAATLLVDTAAGVEPGVVITMPLDRLAAGGAEPVPRSARGRPIEELFRSIEASRGEVPRGSFVGIGGRSYGFGMPLSIAVRRALPVLESTLALEINRLLRIGTPTPARRVQAGAGDEVRPGGRSTGPA